jgi:hypothetical protein
VATRAVVIRRSAPGPGSGATCTVSGALVVQHAADAQTAFTAANVLFATGAALLVGAGVAALFTDWTGAQAQAEATLGR